MFFGPASWIAFIVICAAILVGGGVVGMVARARDNQQAGRTRNR
jgi:hypothetical protein